MAESIESVVAQTYDNWELILVDDGSTDGSTRMAKDYAARFPGKIVYLEHPGHANLGKSATRNLGVLHARGEFIALLDADDIFLPQKLERQVGILNRNPRAAMVYGPTLYWHGWTGKPEDIQRDSYAFLGVTPDQVIEPPELMILYLTNGEYVPCTCGWMMRTSVLDSKGGSEDEFKDLYEDQVFLAKIVLHHPVYVESGSWDKYRQHVRMSSRDEFTQTWSEQPKVLYLKWLAKYVRRQRIKNPDLATALTKALYAHGVTEGPVKVFIRKMLPSPVVKFLKTFVKG